MGDENLKRVLIISGSDSGGGAGMQADIKAVSAFGAYAASAVTAVTVQDTKAVYDIHRIPPDIVRGQIKCVIDDIGVDAIKIGMLHNADVVAAVAQEIDRVSESVHVVLDPVTIATAGTSLLDTNAMALLKAELVLRTTLLTPNLTEARLLTGLEIETVDDMKRAAETLLSLGTEAVLLKGGHLASDDVTDVLMTLDQVQTFTSPRIESRNTHGTGCTLGSAIAACLARGDDLVEAIEKARVYVQEAIRTAPDLGQGQGPLNHFPQVA